MSTVTLTVKDEVVRRVEQAARESNESVHDWIVRQIEKAALEAKSRPAEPARIHPLHPGAITIAPDFNSPLEEFDDYR